MKLRRIPVLTGYRSAALFPRRYANVRRRRNGLRRGMAQRRPLMIAPRQGAIVLRPEFIARHRNVATRQGIAMQPESIALQRSIAPQRRSVFLGQTVAAVSMQFIAPQRWFIRPRRPFIAASSQPIAVFSWVIALRRPLRLEVIAVFAMELRLRLRCRKWLQRGVCLSSQSQMDTKRRGRL